MLFAFSSAQAFILDEEIFSIRSIDSLAERDEYGLLHQGKDPIQPTGTRAIIAGLFITSKASEQLIAEPAYVGALQRDLHRLGYYCGPIDGVFTPASLRCHRPPSEK